jgi:hypothetical protein
MLSDYKIMRIFLVPEYSLRPYLFIVLAIYQIHDRFTKFGHI